MYKLLAVIDKLPLLALAACGRLGFDTATGSASDNDLAPYTITQLALVKGGESITAPGVVIEDGGRHDITKFLPSDGLAIVAEVTGSPAYVRFEINASSHDEQTAPYFSNGNSTTDAVVDDNLHIGPNLVTVTAYDQDNVPRASVTLELVLEVPIPGVQGATSIELIDNYDGHVLAPVDGSPIPMGALASATGEIDVRVTTSPALLGSVTTTIRGPVTHTFVDNWPVYTAFGPFAGFVPMPGTYTITTRPYEFGGEVGPGPETMVTFDIVP